MPSGRHCSTPLFHSLVLVREIHFPFQISAPLVWYRYRDEDGYMASRHQRFLQPKRHIVNELDLSLREKELRCLLDLSRLVEPPAIALDGILAGTVQILNSDMKYPEISYA